MVKKVAYFLGAGFSRPWGLPLMDDFIHKSKDLFIENEEKYSHFKEFYSLLDNYSRIKNIINIDLTNIENLLSLVEMSEKVVESGIVKKVNKFIIDVIEAYTKAFKDIENIAPSLISYEEHIFGDNQLQKCYLVFFANLINLIIHRDSRTGEFNSSINNNIKKRYAVVSLNYDMIIENCFEFLRKSMPIQELILSKEKYDPEWRTLNFAKIHGSVDTGKIIPPTWNKNRSDEISNKWKHAFKILSNANIIRIVGYSLPETDTYIKYLFGVAVKHNFHLEKIEAICIDKDGEIQNRYERYFDQKYFNFINRPFFESHSSKKQFHLLYNNNQGKLIMNLLD